ncbi:MAG: MerR family transcriptional regulator [Chloroflexi bacterium]|nr:MerR family transcriptional regulator [Chloroflexota bacterium]
MSEEMTIGEVARRAGMRPSALRYYESVGLLLPTRRVGGQRRYDAEALHQLMLIQFAQRVGFSLDEIRQLFDGFPAQTPPSQRWRTMTPPKLAEIDLLISRAQAIRKTLESTLRCQCAALEDCAALCDPASVTP